MTDAEGGGRKVLRGLIIAVSIVAALILLIVFRSQVADGVSSLYGVVKDEVPGSTGQKATLVVYLIVSIVLGVLFSKAGHFTAYGIVVLLLPLLWFLFWWGFPLLGLHPTWIESMGMEKLTAGPVWTWAIVAAAVITAVFVPLEIREKFQKRKHRLADAD